MIISHRWKFIFVKTRKTAGSSIEAALCPLLGDNDVITGSERDGTPRRNCHRAMTGHWSALKIYKHVGVTRFQNYKKFCVERNSYEKAVSAWRYHLSIGTTDKNFADYLRSLNLSDWPRYAPNGAPVCEVVQFDNLEAGFAAQCQRIGLPETDIKNYHLKRNPRSRPLGAYYDSETYDLVTEMFRNEIHYFGYSLCES